MKTGSNGFLSNRAHSTEQKLFFWSYPSKKTKTNLPDANEQARGTGGRTWKHLAIGLERACFSVEHEIATGNSDGDVPRFDLSWCHYHKGCSLPILATSSPLLCLQIISLGPLDQRGPRSEVCHGDQALGQEVVAIGDKHTDTVAIATSASAC